MDRKKWLRINSLLREHAIDKSQFQHVGCIKQHPTESDAHFYEKVKLARAAFKSDKPFLTECWTTDRKRRYDFFDLEDGLVIEIETNPMVEKEGAKTIRIDKERI